MIQTDDIFKEAIEALNHDVYSQRELVMLLTELQNKIGDQVESLLEEKQDQSVLDNEVLYKKCKECIKSILSETFDDQENYDLSLSHDNKIEVEFNRKSYPQLAEEILDELNEII